MNISIGVLTLPEDKKAKLKDHGFLFVDNLTDTDAQLFLKGIDEEEVNKFHAKPIIQSALDVWKSEVSRRHVVTFSSQLDLLLGGGIELQAITDLCGAPGTGKTQLCLQLCIDVQLPESLGGVSGHALYLDTNYGFSKSRLQDVAEGCVQHCARSPSSGEGEVPGVVQLLGGVHVFCTPVGTLEEMLAALVSIRNTLASLPQVRLVIIDSFSKPFLLYCEDMKKRTAMIYDVLSTLQNLAWEFNVAIVTTSQLTTVVRADGEASVVPGLGQGFSHRVTHRLMLGIVTRGCDTRRAAQMLKSPSRPRQSAFFQILKSGVRDEGVQV